MTIRRCAAVLLLAVGLTVPTTVGAFASAPTTSTDTTSAATSDTAPDLGTPEPDSSPSTKDTAAEAATPPDGPDGPGGALGTWGGTARTTAASSTTKPRTTTVSSRATGLHQVTPVRLIDTRTSEPVGRGATLTVPVAGQFGIPSTATAAVINLTVDSPSASGFVTASPCGAAYGTSTINFSAGQTIANLALVSLGTGGALCITPSVATDVLVDVSGYIATGGQLYTPIEPTRILDTRQTASPVAANVPTVLAVAGTFGLPANDLKAVSVNVTVTSPAGAGYATVYPCGATPPLASNVNFAKGQPAAANGAIVGVDATGSICVVSSVQGHLIVDLGGWFGSTGTEVQPAAPTRLVDTREAAGKVRAGAELQVFSAPGALGTIVNVTVTQPTAGGYLTIWACGSAKPTTSALNFAGGQTIANAVLAPVSTDGRVCISPSVDTQVIVDRTAILGLAGSGSLDSTGSLATDFALTQRGATYVAMNPYRFGDSKYGQAWDCSTGETSCSRVDTQGKTRTVTTGAYVYDCSGLVVAAWLRAGVDLVKLGAAWTEPMLQKLPQVTRDQARVGDLIMFDFDTTDADPVEHVGLYLSATEMVHAGTCAGGVSAVCRTTIPWDKAIAVLRPPTA